MSLNKHTREYDGGSPDLPLATGDVFRSHDLMRDLEYLQERAGRITLDLFDLSAVLMKGGVVSKGTGDTLNITPAVAYIPHQVKTPDSYAGNPPTVKNEDSIRRVASTQQTNMAVAGATLDGSTVNYVKLAVLESNGSSRARLKGSGSYVYEKVDSYVITVNSSAPTSYELELARFRGSTGSTFYFMKQTRTPVVNKPEWNAGQELAALTVSGMDRPVVAAMTETRFAYFDEGNDSLRAYDVGLGVIALAGAGLAITAGHPAIAALSDTDIVFIDAANDSLRRYSFNGSIWSLVGSGLTISGCTAPALAMLNETDVAFWDAGIDELRVYRWSGSVFAQIGSSFSLADTFGALAALNGTDVVFKGEAGDTLQTYRWSGSAFSALGSPSAALSLSQANLCSLNENDVVVNSSSGPPRVYYIYRFDGSSWSAIGDPRPITTSVLGNNGVAALNGTDIVFGTASTDDEIVVHRIGWSPARPHHPRLLGV